MWYDYDEQWKNGLICVKLPNPTGSKEMPIGTVMIFMQEDPPYGWVLLLKGHNCIVCKKVK